MPRSQDDNGFGTGSDFRDTGGDLGNYMSGFFGGSSPSDSGSPSPRVTTEPVGPRTNDPTSGGANWAVGNTSQAGSPNPNDPNAVFGSIYQQFGLDPNNPGNGLANVQYFLDRMNQTGGWSGTNQQYWKDRLTQEIQKAKTGQVGNLIDTGSTAGGFADPAYQQLLALANQRIGALNQPISFPSIDKYMSMLTANQDAAKQRAQTFADQLTGRVGQLQQPLLSQADVANQQALTSNNLIASRDAALKNAQQKRYASGFAPTSGLNAGDQRSINEQYNNRQAQIDATLREQQIQGDEQRRNEATQLQGLAQQALQGGDVTALQNQAQVADLENQLYNINQSRAREQLSTAQLPVDLTNQGYANAFNSAYSGSNPLNSILGLLALGNNQQNLQQANQNNNAGGLAGIINWLMQGA